MIVRIQDLPFFRFLSCKLLILRPTPAGPSRMTIAIVAADIGWTSQPTSRNVPCAWPDRKGHELLHAMLSQTSGTSIRLWLDKETTIVWKHGTWGRASLSEERYRKVTRYACQLPRDWRDSCTLCMLDFWKSPLFTLVRRMITHWKYRGQHLHQHL